MTVELCGGINVVEVVVGHLCLGFRALQFPLEPFEIISMPTTTENGIKGVFEKEYNQMVLGNKGVWCVLFVVCGRKVDPGSTLFTLRYLANALAMASCSAKDQCTKILSPKDSEERCDRASLVR